MATPALIEQSFLEKLERLTIHWQRSFGGLVGGHNSSRFAGPGQEFLDHRHFHQGDDLRAVNWRAYMRLEKLFLKMFQVEPRVPVRVLLDVSGSMTSGAITTPERLSKFDYARKLAGALSYIGLVRLDTMHLIPFREHLGEAMVCGGGRHRFVQAARFLMALKAEGRTDYLQVAKQFATTYSQRGLIIVISDFLSDDQVEKPLQYLADMGNELLLVQLFAPEDREPPWDGELDLVDAETGQKLEMSLDAEARARYTAAFDDHARNVQQMAQRAGGRYISVSTSVSLEEVVFGSLMRSGGIY